MTTATAEAKQQRGRIQLQVGAIYALVAVVAGVALLVSGNYLLLYGEAAKMGWLSWTLIATLDAGGIAGTLVWVLSQGHARAWGRGIAIANLGASILGNILGHLLQSTAISNGPGLQILTGVVFPAELFAMVHLALMFRRETAPAQPAAVGTTPPVPTPVVDTPTTPAPLPPVSHPVVVPRPPVVPTPVVRTPTPAPIAAPVRPVVVPTPPAKPTRRPVAATTAATTEVTPELLARVERWRSQRIEAHKPIGRRHMTAPIEQGGLGISEGVYRKVFAAMNKDRQLEESA